MFILIHGANHSSRCWEPIIDRLTAPALAIDLPGRGRHPAPLDKVHVADVIESAVEDIEDADANDAVLVGHSMAGLSIPGIIDRVHERLRHIAFVSCYVPQHGELMLSEMPADLVELANLVEPDPAGALPGTKLSVQTMCYDMDEEQTAFTLDVRVPEAYCRCATQSRVTASSTDRLRPPAIRATSLKNEAAAATRRDALICARLDGRLTDVQRALWRVTDRHMRGTIDPRRGGWVRRRTLRRVRW